MTGNGSLLASYSIDRRDERNNIPINPNQARYNFELPQTHQGVRLSGTYDLPWHMLFSSTFTGQSGEYFSRIVQVRNALNTNVNVTVEGQAGRYDWVKLVDARLAKTVAIGKHSLEGMFDAFNLLNSNAVANFTLLNGANYNRILSGLQPRTIQIGARLEF